MVEKVKVASRNAVLNVKVFNKDAAESCILLHGGPGSPDYLEHAALLFPKRLRVICFDQRGVGDSECINGKYEFSDYINDIDSITNYFNLEKFHLFGHSWGAVLAQVFFKKKRDKVKSLFLCNPAPGTGKYWRNMLFLEIKYIAKKVKLQDAIEYISFVLPKFSKKGKQKAMERFYCTTWRYYFKPGDIVPEIDPKWIKGISAEATLKTLKTILKAKSSFLDDIDAGNIPVAILTGEDDFVATCIASTQKRFPGAKNYFLTYAGHVPWLQNEKEFKEAIENFYISISENKK